MRFETSDQLVALKYLLGSFCLFGVREIPRQGTSLVVQNASLCNIIPRVQVAVEGGFIRRTSRYGVDFGYDGNAFKVVVRYCMRKGDSAALREFRQLATEIISFSSNSNPSPLAVWKKSTFIFVEQKAVKLERYL